MDRLILLRHGEAEAGSETGGDFGRRLTARGREASAAVASAIEAGFTKSKLYMTVPP